eukprot:CCRYP_020281-RA/>CCRYP_020281-RA protein AED:0.39 eAED:0.39 QI:0/0/0/1/0/0/2/0/226
MDVLAVFRMCMPEEFMRVHMIPSMNQHLDVICVARLSLLHGLLCRGVADVIVVEQEGCQSVRGCSLSAVNNQRHAPIGLQDIWATKWWPHCQFTFMCSVAEVNVNNSIARALGTPADHQIVFRKKLAKAMINNHLTESGGIQHSLIRAKKRSRVFIEIEHKHMIKPNKTGCWDPTKKIFTPVKMAYLKEKCRTCDATIGTYCSCDKGTPMCKVCYGKHLVAVENIN